MHAKEVYDRPTEDLKLLWLRYCNRLEKIGTKGVIAMYHKSIEQLWKLHVPGKTPRPRTEEQVWKIATRERFWNWHKFGRSQSMMDHYFDKFLNYAKFEDGEIPCTSKYLLEESDKRRKPLLEICLKYGKTGEVPMDHIKDLIR